jgi:hypothetical protein
MKEGTLPKDDNTIIETPEDKIKRIVEIVKQDLGFTNINQRMDEQAKMLDAVIKELGNTNASINQIVPHIDRWLKMEQGQNNTTTVSTTSVGSNALTPSITMDKMTLAKEIAGPIAEIVKAIRGTRLV